MKNTIGKITPAKPSFGFRCWDVEGICDGQPFRMDRLPENIPGSGCPSDDDIFQHVFLDRQRIASLNLLS